MVEAFGSEAAREGKYYGKRNCQLDPARAFYAPFKDREGDH